MHLLLFYVWRNLKKYFFFGFLFSVLFSFDFFGGVSTNNFFFDAISRYRFQFSVLLFCCLATNLTWIKLWNRLRSNLDLPESGFALFYSLCCLFVVCFCFLGASWLQRFGVLSKLVLLLDLVAWLHYLINYNVITKN